MGFDWRRRRRRGASARVEDSVARGPRISYVRKKGMMFRISLPTMQNAYLITHGWGGGECDRVEGSGFSRRRSMLKSEQGPPLSRARTPNNGQGSQVFGRKKGTGGEGRGRSGMGLLSRFSRAAAAAPSGPLYCSALESNITV